jgi:hypothetical protein
VIEISTRINPISYEKPYLKRIGITIYCVATLFYFFKVGLSTTKTKFKV